VVFAATLFCECWFFFFKIISKRTKYRRAICWLMNGNYSIRVEVFTAVTMKNAVFWDVVPCRSCVNRRFRVMYRLHLQGRKIRERGTSLSRGLQTAGDTFCRNVGSHKIYRMPHPRRRHSSVITVLTSRRNHCHIIKSQVVIIIGNWAITIIVPKHVNCATVPKDVLILLILLWHCPECRPRQMNA
jgi:predicted RNA binding protein YcfA (HicA-like mRNA interferase family)